MKLSAIALKNLKRNFSFYSLYLFSVSFVLMIYFCFTSFSMNQVIMEKISSDGRVETMCQTVAVFIVAFVIFYMFYSNNFFMRRRMRELGRYSDRQCPPQRSYRRNRRTFRNYHRSGCNPFDLSGSGKVNPIICCCGFDYIDIIQCKIASKVHPS